MALEGIIVEQAAGQGVWAVLFVSMLFYVIYEKKQSDLRNDARERKSLEREECLKKLLIDLADKLGAINDACKALERIEKKLK